jgi:hypothetical protein
MAAVALGLVALAATLPRRAARPEPEAEPAAVR